MSFNPQAAKTWLQNNVHNLIPSNAARYKFGEVGLKLGSNALGLSAEIPTVEGTVVHCNPEFYVVKIERNAFKFVDPSMLPEPLALNSKVRITPYKRRRFDGSFLTDPERVEDSGTGFRVSTYVLGVNHSAIPLPKPRTIYAEQMLELLHHGKCEDGVRRISNLLVDCKATNFKMHEPPEVDTETGEDLGPWVDPQIVFDCNTQKFVGQVTIGVDVAQDVYYVELSKADAEGQMRIHTKCSQVHFNQMAQVLQDLLCDGRWKFAKVDVLKAAPKRKTAAGVSA